MNCQIMEPDRIGPDMTPKRPLKDKLVDIPRRTLKALTTKDGLVGDYDYAFLFTPTIPFLKRERKVAPFFGLNDKMPILLALLLGFQHALSMLAGVITPPIILSGQSGANLDAETAQYLVSTSLIVCGILSSVQITRLHIYKTSYFIGTGLISVVGTSFATIPVATGGLAQMYATGFCPTDADGNPLPCPRGYGAVLGTASICALLEICLSFAPAKVLKRVFPPLVTGPTVVLIGINLIGSAFQAWAGGSGTCASRPDSGPYQLCPSNTAPHALPWGSAEFIGLGFLVFVTIIICERLGSPIMKSCAVVIGLLIGCIVAAACGYFDKSGIDAAPAASFIWVKTFPLSLYGPMVLPFLAVFLVLMMEAIGDITASCDVSRLEVEGRIFESRIQGGVLADGLNGVIACLCTITPMSTFAQNVSCFSSSGIPHRKRQADWHPEWCHCAHALCKSKGRLLLLFLLDRHGHLFQVRGRPCGHSIPRFGWHDDLSVLRGRHLWCPHHLDSPLYPTQPVYPHGRDVAWVWCHPSSRTYQSLSASTIGDIN